MKYDFSYKDNEGDEYQSNEHKTLQAARKEVKKVRADGGSIIETWIYDENDKFQGRWNPSAPSRPRW